MMAIKKLFWCRGLILSGLLVGLGNVFSAKSYGSPVLDSYSRESVKLLPEVVPNAQATEQLFFSPSLKVEDERLAQQPPNALPERTFAVRKIEVLGNTVFQAEQFTPLIQPLVGQTVTESQLNQVAQEITQLYLNQGYINSRAEISQINPDGVVVIQVLEGIVPVKNVVIEGAGNLENYVRDRILLGVGKPVNVRAIEEQLRLLQENPLFTGVEASLRSPNANLGQEVAPNVSALFVRVTLADPFAGSLSFDNYSPPSVGATRMSLDLSHRNLTGLGDELAVSWRPRLEAFTETYRLELSYEVPINPMNGTLALRGLVDDNRVVDGPFVPFDISGSSDRYEFVYRQPIIRKLGKELAFSLGFQYFQGQTFLLDTPFPFGVGPNAQGNSRTSVFVIGADYVSRDVAGAWGLRSQFRIGACIFNATCNPFNPDPSSINTTDIPRADFFSWLFQMQRLQVLDRDNLLVIQFDLQLTPDRLLPSEQFVIGGGQSVRGYRQNVLGGDNGFRFSIENRMTVARNERGDSVFTIAPFFDLGAVWNTPGNPNIIIANDNVIAGLGLGLIWQPFKGFNLRLDYAPPLMNLNIRGNNIQDDGFYFSASYEF